MTDYPEFDEYVEGKIKDTPPECPYWEDGEHMFHRPSGDEIRRKGFHMRSKVCACGAEVKPR